MVFGILPRFRNLWESEGPYIYVGGPRKSGKTTFCAQYAFNYGLNHPNSTILLFGKEYELRVLFEMIRSIPCSFKEKERCFFIELKNRSKFYFKTRLDSTFYKGRFIDLLVTDTESYKLPEMEQNALLDLYDYAAARNHPFITVYSEDTEELT